VGYGGEHRRADSGGVKLTGRLAVPAEAAEATEAGSGIQMQKRSSLKREGCAANHGRGEEDLAVALASERRGSRSRQSATRPPLS
jgi:hypothetical protein